MGKVLISGVAPQMKVPSQKILASDLAVGSVVKLMENGVATEYLVVNQGKPSGSSLYDDSCDGTWLLRKDIKEKRQWHSSDVNDYKNSTIHAWLNGDFFNLFGSVEQATIKQVKIPYVNGNGSSGSVSSGANGLSTKIFFLSGYEVGGLQSSSSYLPIDGAKTEFFLSGEGGSQWQQRIAYLNAVATAWWLRSAYMNSTARVTFVNITGNTTYSDASDANGIRPSLILPSNAVFDTNTMLLKGVS